MSIRFERHALYEEVWSTPLTQLAKKYGLSDNGLRKVCKALNIPLPKIGHWAKQAAGHQVSREPLPEHAERTEFVSHPDPATPASKEQVEDKVWLAEREAFERLPENHIDVDLHPKRLHPLLISTRDQLLKLVKEADAAKKEAEKEKKRPQSARRWSPDFNFLRWKLFESRGKLLGNRKQDLPFRVTPETWERALTIISAFLYTAEARGFKIKKGDKDNRLSLMTNDGEANIRITERLKDEIREGNDRIKVPTGILRLHVGYLRSVSETIIEETTQLRLQDNLNEVFCRTYRVIVRDRAHKRQLDEWHHQFEEEQRKRQEAEKRRLEEIQRRQDELDRRNDLIKEASDWQCARLIHEYLDHLDESILSRGSPPISVEFNEWREWAIHVARELNPTEARLELTTPGGAE